MAYETQLDWVNRVFNRTGLIALEKTHAGRANGVRTAELAGVSDSQIRRAGRWNNDALSQSYLTNLPRKFVHGPWLASIPTLRGGSIFLGPWFESYDSRDRQSAFMMPEIQGQQKPGEHLDRDDLAAQGFLHLLQQLRTILLQDSALMQPKFPEHPVWTHSVFQRNDYSEFAEAARLANTQTEEPCKVRLRQTVPQVADQLRIIRQDFGVATDCLHAAIQRGFGSLEAQVGDLVNGR
ncbi:hypothetical protein ACJ73_10022, partial [Blastomyces percursus]